MTDTRQRDPRIPPIKGKPRKPKFNAIVEPHAINLRLPGAWVRNLDAWCNEHQVTLPAFVRKAVWEQMQRLGVPTE